MPLYAGARELIRANLETIKQGKKAGLVAIGSLTDAQLESVNEVRNASGYPPLKAEVVFFGQHVYASRVLRDGYTIDDVIDQIASGMDDGAVFIRTPHMTALENSTPRADRYGNTVRDRIVLECSARYPRPELFSVVPKGDSNRPKKRPPIRHERPEPQRLARVTVASDAPVAAKDSMDL
ncbi:MAG TPA: hypothetical protein VMU19_15340 [Bryobacteraceae bacterium]|nr:hypothetical protein [Bryobacteraceae bacterium]